MDDDAEKPVPTDHPDKLLTAAAQRALTEAAQRRAEIDAKGQGPTETGGPTGLEPTRFGDWERKGMTSDF